MKDLKAAVYAKYRAQNRLYAVMIELTYRCICRCIHCYIDEYAGPELTTDEVLDLLSQLKEEGVINIGFTGGEIFLRKDLEIILSEAAKSGFFINLLTTGILIDEAAADMMKRNRINAVEISLQGAKAETHDMIMRHPGAFDKTLKAVRLLRDREISVALKNTIFKQNVGELEEMAALAASYNCLFNASMSVLPKMDGNLEPLSYTIDFETAAALNPEWVSGGLIPDEDTSKGALLTCNAGWTSCGISPLGEVTPCLIWRRPVGNIHTQSIQNLWHEKPDPYLEKVRTAVPADCTECYPCTVKKSCRRCPGMAFAETGDFLAAVPSACRIAGREQS